MPHFKKDHVKMLWSGIGLRLAWVIGLIDFSLEQLLLKQLLLKQMSGNCRNVYQN